MVKVALAMIVRGKKEEAPLLKKCLDSVAKHVDGIFIQVNHKPTENNSVQVWETAQKYTDNIEDYEWDGSFVHARTANFAQVPKDYDFILWLDSDDTVENPEKIKETAEVCPKGVSAINASYDYAHDEYGNVTVPHYVARLVRNNGIYAWKSSFSDEKYSVHETLVKQRVSSERISEEFKVVHHADNERSIQSLYRNIDLLEKMYDHEREIDHVDPRTLFYLGTHLYDAGRFDEAEVLLQGYMSMSGWNNERSEALVYLGLIFAQERGKHTKNDARRAYALAILEAPNNPRPYTEIASLELADKRYDSAAEWALKAIKCEKRQTAMALRPMDSTFRPYTIYAEALTRLGGTRLETAMEYIGKALKMRPNDPDVKAQQDMIENLIEVRDLNRAFAKLVRALGHDKTKLRYLLRSVPEKLSDSPVVAQVRSENVPPKKWPKKSLVIYCGASIIETWGPSSLTKGVGGSEEAVVRLKVELEKLGWDVHVYGTPGDDVDATWHNYWDFNPNDKFDVVVAWRMPWFYDWDIDARKKYIWLHDVMETSEFTKERMDKIDGVIVLSKYHRAIYPNIPDDKIFLSANGITADEFEKYDGKFKRDPHRIIWMSSHVRGLEVLYLIWPEVKKAVPDATLDIFYGWESFVNVLKDNPDRMNWMAKMQAWEKELKGVTDHGKISQEQIVQEIFKSGVWAYPCPFPEIYCITAIKAQAGGCIPVSSDFAALDETVQFGIKIHMKAQKEDISVGKWENAEVQAYKDALIDVLKHPQKYQKEQKKMMDWARSQSWEAVAKQWIEEFGA